MSYLYLSLLVISISFPLFFTIFYIDFIKKWKLFFISTATIAVIFLIWDAIFTEMGVWGFNSEYYLGFLLIKMPIEEWLFFFTIPFASLFIHYSLYHAYPKLLINKNLTIFLSFFLITFSVYLAFINSLKLYTLVNFSTLTLTLFIGVIYNAHLLQKFLISFLIIIIPFFIVNGILTGFLTENPVVWYNSNEIIGFRLLTIPIEDIGYAFSMLFSNLMIFEFLKQKNKILN